MWLMHDAEPTKHWISGKAWWQGDPGESLTPLIIKQGIDSGTRGNYWKLSAQGGDKDQTWPPIMWSWPGLYLVFRMSSEYLVMEHENGGWKSFKYSFCCIKWPLLCIRTPSARCHSVGVKAPSIKVFTVLPNASAQATWGWKKQVRVFLFSPPLNSGPLCMFKGFFLADFQL